MSQPVARSEQYSDEDILYYSDGSSQSRTSSPSFGPFNPAPVNEIGYHSYADDNLRLFSRGDVHTPPTALPSPQSLPSSISYDASFHPSLVNNMISYQHHIWNMPDSPLSMSLTLLEGGEHGTFYPHYEDAQATAVPPQLVSPLSSQQYSLPAGVPPERSLSHPDYAGPSYGQGGTFVMLSPDQFQQIATELETIVTFGSDERPSDDKCDALLEPVPHPPTSRGKGSRGGIEYYRCWWPGCHQTVKRHDHAIDHIASHAGSKPRVCGNCHRGFLRDADLKRHKRTCGKKKKNTILKREGHSLNSKKPVGDSMLRSCFDLFSYIVAERGHAHGLQLCLLAHLLTLYSTLLLLLSRWNRARQVDIRYRRRAETKTYSRLVDVSKFQQVASPHLGRVPVNTKS